jgi:hypothetical protein
VKTVSVTCTALPSTDPRSGESRKQAEAQTAQSRRHSHETPDLTVTFERRFKTPPEDPVPV